MLSSILTSVIFILNFAALTIATEPETNAQALVQSEPTPTMQLLIDAESEVEWIPAPRLTPELLSRARAEITNNPEIDSALRLILAPTPTDQILRAKYAAWKTLEDHDAIWSMVAMANLNGTLRPGALRLLTRLGDTRTVPDLIRLAEHMPDLLSESDSPDFHRLTSEKLRLLLSRLTGEWILDEDVTLPQAARRWRIAHETQTLSEIELARRAMHKQLSQIDNWRYSADMISARLSFLNALRRVYGSRLQIRVQSEDLNAKAEAFRIASEAVHSLLLEWNPVGWTREEIERVLGKPGQSDDGSIEYWWDWGLGGFGLHFKFIADRPAHSFEIIPGE
ncbi:MAG: hypothetical protein JKX70_08630 [Phycisphaerales bacterium]|nr:hypothetical protein [Phycisphaerales bacterium]